MQSDRNESPDTASLREWIENTVLKQDRYDTHLIGERTVLFEHGYHGTLAEALLDGQIGRAHV